MNPITPISPTNPAKLHDKYVHPKCTLQNLGYLGVLGVLGHLGQLGIHLLGNMLGAVDEG